MTFKHSEEHTTCPQCKERTVVTWPNYKTREMVEMCLKCSYRKATFLGSKIEQWKWLWKDCESTGLHKVV